MSAAPVIAGRDTELATLDAFVANIHERASILALEGDIGSGKTTLWMYGLEAASHSGATVLVANPSEAETGFAYAGLADLLSRSSIGFTTSRRRCVARLSMRS